ncbi:uncharacterized protein LOC106641589 [Copidosoma floridanum]|uniref:uncharacterized protein LOC106641589 n=1 Tax=Copidosoma floridanum TaxID=29053 RepID=UPI0006C98E73|nr:uncharacterized protein LOC106641589 [Copidosoma floridanum]
MLRRLLEESAVKANSNRSSSGAAAVAAIQPVAPNTSNRGVGPASGGPTDPSGAVAAAVGPPAHLQQHNSTPPYLPEADDLEYSILAAFSDMETVLLACISTLLPLIVALGIAFGIRHVWRKYKGRRGSGSSASGLPWYRGVCSRDDTVESLHHRPHSADGQTIIQPNTQILSAQDLANGIRPHYCDSMMQGAQGLDAGTVTYASDASGSHTSKSTNGNIITLTLKNNHLIVETEERAVTMEDSRSRKFQDNGCSVIVEVPPSYGREETAGSAESNDDIDAQVTDQQALVHREEISEDRRCDFDKSKLFGSTNTGLSQSDLSICSQGSVNPSYRYGNQLEYEADSFGYSAMYGAGGSGTSKPQTSNGSATLLKPEVASGTTKWVEFDRSPDTEATPPTKDPRNDSTEPQQQLNGTAPNDLLLAVEVGSGSTKPVITGAILKDEASLQEETFQEQQRKLGNGTLTPERPATEDGTPTLPESRNGDAGTRQEGSTFGPGHKRSGSIPPRLIEEGLEPECRKHLDIYSQIKTSTKGMLVGLSPKFELLENEASPVDDKEAS